MKRIISLAVLLLSALMVFSQDKTIVDPNASIRELRGKTFTQIKVSHAIKLIISQGTEQSIAVSADEEKFKEDIVTEIDGNTLKVYSKNNNNVLSNRRNRRLTVYVSFTKLEYLDASGATDVMAVGAIEQPSLKLELSGASTLKAGLKVDFLNIELSGASKAVLSGKTTDSKIECSGASDLRAYSLSIDNANLEASGASSMDLTVMKELRVDASGASSIHYKGTASITNIKTSGASSVKRED
ncbi:MAG: head GIN domain-containing protein [Ferruginibacter sp.]